MAYFGQGSPFFCGVVMDELTLVAEKCRSLGWLVSVRRDTEWRYRKGVQKRVSVIRLAINPPNGSAFDWDITVHEFPFSAVDYLNAQILHSA